MNEVIKFVLVLVSVALADVAWAKYVLHTAQHKPLSASIFAVFITVIGGFNAIQYVESGGWSLIPAGIGAFIGTYIPILLEKRKKK